MPGVALPDYGPKQRDATTTTARCPPPLVAARRGPLPTAACGAVVSRTGGGRCSRPWPLEIDGRHIISAALFSTAGGVKGRRRRGGGGEEASQAQGSVHSAERGREGKSRKQAKEQEASERAEALLGQSQAPTLVQAEIVPDCCLPATAGETTMLRRTANAWERPAGNGRGLRP